MNQYVLCSDLHGHWDVCSIRHPQTVMSYFWGVIRMRKTMKGVATSNSHILYISSGDPPLVSLQKEPTTPALLETRNVIAKWRHAVC